jgi:hypothetical protein
VAAPAAPTTAISDEEKAMNFFRSGQTMLRLGREALARGAFRQAATLDPSLKPKIDEALRKAGFTP